MGIAEQIIAEAIVKYADDDHAALVRGRRWHTVTDSVENTVYVNARRAGLSIPEAMALGREAVDMLNDHDGRTNAERLRSAAAAPWMRKAVNA